MRIRPEQPTDLRKIFALNAAAFDTDAEAWLVERLRDDGVLALSLVAVVYETIIGHIAFSPVTVDGHPTRGVGLAPLAVAAEQRGRGVGAKLVRAGIDACRQAGFEFVVVLGEPGYYRRFGFDSASRFGLTNVYGVDDPFMALALRNDAPPAGGQVRYGPAFDELG
jgi:putative acetyltransferase